MAGCLRWKALGCMLAPAMLSGCASVGCCITIGSESQAQARYLVIGVGVVTLPKAAPDGISAARVSAIGISAAGGPLPRASAGYLSLSEVIVGPATPDVLVEVGGCVDGISIGKREFLRPPAP